MRGRRRSGETGLSLVEAFVAAGVLAGFAAVSCLTLQRAIHRFEAPCAARRALSDLRLRRAQAVARARSVAVVFRRAGGAWVVAIHEDGDGDGVRADDMRRGIDACVDGPEVFDRRYGSARPGFLPGLVDLRSPPPSSEPLGPLEDPVRFGTTDVVSCGPRGGMTSGTLYLTDGRERQLALVVYGPTGRLRLWEYDRKTRTWRRS